MSNGPNSFVPNAQNPRALRDAFGQFVTGVTIVTARAETGPVAITANSFTSVSLDPPIVLWSANSSSGRFPHFKAAKHYAIHVLAGHQDDLCWKAARDLNGLADVEMSENEHGVPLIENCLARFECELYAMHPAGDHELVLGQVTRVETNTEQEALTFFQGQIHQLEQARKAG